MTNKHVLIVAAFCAAASGAAAGAPPAQADGWARGAYADVRLVSASPTVGSARRLRLGLEFRLKPGWKIFWRSPGAAGLPPMVDWSGSQNVARAALRWPAPERFVTFGLVGRGYSKHVVLPIDIRPATPGRPVRLVAGLRYQLCSDICVPGEARLTLALAAGPATPGPEAALIARYERRVPVPFDASGLAALDVLGARRGSGAVLRVRVATKGRKLARPRVIVETSRTLRVGAPIRRKLSADRARFEVWLPARIVGKDATLVGMPVTVTLIDGDFAAERRTQVQDLR